MIDLTTRICPPFADSWWNSFKTIHFQHIRVTGTNKFSPFFDGFHVSGRNSIKNEQCNVAKFQVRGCLHILSWTKGRGAANDEKSLWGGFESPYAWFPIEFHFWVKYVNNEEWRRCFQGTRLMHSRTCLHCGDSKILSWNLSGGKIKTIFVEKA